MGRAMHTEEIGHDPTPQPRRVRAAAALLVALVAAGGWTVHARSAGPGDPQRADLGLQADEQAGPVVVADICPLRTDHQTTVTVTFGLRNVGSAPLTLVRVDPMLPRGGLRLTATATRSGSCAAPGPSTRTIAPHGRVLVSFRFTLPRTCPTALPVQARLQVREGGTTTTLQLPVVNDLSGTRYDTCIPGQW